MAKVEYVRRKPKLKEVFVRLEDHLECVCTPHHHVVEHSDAEIGKCEVSSKVLYIFNKCPRILGLQKKSAAGLLNPITHIV